MTREEGRRYLMEQGVRETEVDFVVSVFSEAKEFTKEDLTIVTIFDSAVSLGEDYLEKVVGELDHHISAVLDRQLLGEHIACTCDEYLVLEDGRIIQFEL